MGRGVKAVLSIFEMAVGVGLFLSGRWQGYRLQWVHSPRSGGCEHSINPCILHPWFKYTSVLWMSGINFAVAPCHLFIPSEQSIAFMHYCTFLVIYDYWIMIIIIIYRDWPHKEQFLFTYFLQKKKYEN